MKIYQSRTSVQSISISISLLRSKRPSKSRVLASISLHSGLDQGSRIPGLGLRRLLASGVVLLLEVLDLLSLLHSVIPAVLRAKPALSGHPVDKLALNDAVEIQAFFRDEKTKSVPNLPK